MTPIQYVDSHTAGEPTRVVYAGGPSLGNGPLDERLARLKNEFDHFRRSVVLEPRGSDALVGALLCEPVDADCTTGVIFFNNAGYLNMCGHGAMGVAATLAHLGRVAGQQCRLETPVGAVNVTLTSPHRVTIANVPSYRYHAQAEVEVNGMGKLRGDVAWGGNWFFLLKESPLPLTIDRLPELSSAAWRLYQALAQQGVTGAEGAPIDHIEFCGPPVAPDANGRNFVMCPGGAYDRSPCGTGTSAKLACLAADGELQPGDTWVQEGILGTRFVGTFRKLTGGLITPTVTGDAYVTAEGRLVLNSNDPFRFGIPAGNGP